MVSGPHRAHDGGWLTKILPGTPTTAEWAVSAVVSASGVDWLGSIPETDSPKTVY